jgi:tetratricopeptide (TPR) repeat protein
MRYWIITIITGVALGMVTMLTPLGGYLGMTRDGGEKIEDISRAELLKKIEGMRIDAVRMVSDGRDVEAFQVLLKLIDINHYDQFGYVQLARTLETAGEEKFLSTFNKTVNAIPAIEIDRTLAAVYFYANKADPAKKHIDAFVKKSPNDLAGLFYKGAIARLSGDNAQAIKDLTAVIGREKTYYFAYLELNLAYEKMGDNVMAGKMMDLALKNSPANSKDGICHGLPPIGKKA